MRKKGPTPFHPTPFQAEAAAISQQLRELAGRAPEAEAGRQPEGGGETVEGRLDAAERQLAELLRSHPPSSPRRGQAEWEAPLCELRGELEAVRREVVEVASASQNVRESQSTQSTDHDRYDGRGVGVAGVSAAVQQSAYLSSPAPRGQPPPVTPERQRTPMAASSSRSPPDSGPPPSPVGRREPACHTVTCNTPPPPPESKSTIICVLN
jgi:hypothetical protein